MIYQKIHRIFIIIAGENNKKRKIMSDDKAVVQNVQTLLKQFNLELGKFKKSCKKLGTNSDSENIRDAISGSRTTINGLIRTIKEDALDTVQNKTYKTKFKRDFDNLVKQYKMVNVDATRKEREFTVRTSNVQTMNIETHAISDFEREKNQARTQTQTTQQKTLAEKVRRQTLMTNAAIQQEQHEEIVKINRDLGVVNDMFKDLGKLTEQQGEQIEKIEVHVDATADSVEKGTKELDEAKRLQNSLRKKKLISLGIGILILLAFCIPLIIHLTSNSGKS